MVRPRHRSHYPSFARPLLNRYLTAHRLARNGQLPICQAAWYIKTQATFSDAIAAVRQQLWHPANFFTCHSKHKMVKIPHALYSGLCHAISYAA
jgi:hypothetical protein